MFREILVKKTEEGTEVDLWPGMFTKPEFEKEPTEANPEIKTDLGMVGGKLSPLKIYYPNNIDLENILNAADSVEREDGLFSKTEHCPQCERKRREIVARLRDAFKQGSNSDERIRNFQVEGAKIQRELRDEGYKVPDRPVFGDEAIEVREQNRLSTVEPKQEYEESEIAPVIPVQDKSSIAKQTLPSKTNAFEFDKKEEDVIDNINGAISSIERTILLLYHAPEKIIVDD